jgi:protein-disulfide isomerase
MLELIKSKLPIIGIILILIIAIVGIAFYAIGKREETKKLESKMDSVNAEWYKGDANATVTVDIYSDFKCSHCRDFATDPEVKLIAEYAGKPVKFVYKHFPIFANSEIVSEAAEAAGSQGKFWEYHDKLYANFSKNTRADLEKFASEIGLDVEKFKSDLDKHTFRGDVNADKKAGDELKINGTPTIFVNKTKVAIREYYTDIKAAIDQALNVGTTSSDSTSSTSTSSSTTSTTAPN